MVKSAKPQIFAESGLARGLCSLVDGKLMNEDVNLRSKPS